MFLHHITFWNMQASQHQLRRFVSLVPTDKSLAFLRTMQVTGLYCPLVHRFTNFAVYRLFWSFSKLFLILWCLNKISGIRFYQGRLGSQMLGWEHDSSERQRKHPADLPPQLTAQVVPTHAKSLLQTECPPFYSLWIPLSTLLTTSYSP